MIGAHFKATQQAMGDWLVKACKTPALKTLLGGIGFPTPVALARGAGRFKTGPRALAGTEVLVAGLPGAADRAGLGAALVQAQGGAIIKALPTGGKAPAAVLVDATAVRSPGDATALAIDVLKPLVGGLPKNSRVSVLVGDGPGDAGVLASGVCSLLRSLSKEVGAKGTTVNAVRVPTTVPEEVQLAAAGWPASFFLLPDCAFVTGQDVSLSVAAGAPPSPSAQEGEAGLARSRLSGKVALVTGAGRGIGAAIAVRLAAEGARVVGVDLPPRAGGKPSPLGPLMRQLGGVAVEDDVTDPAAAARLCAVLAAQGGVDVVVHNAGITKDKTLRNMAPEAFAGVVSVNLRAIERLNRALLGEASEQLHGWPAWDGTTVSTAATTTPPVLRPGGRIIGLSSINGIAGAAGQTNYSFTKAALIGYAHALAPRLATSPLAATFNCVAPGFIETEMTAKIPLGIREVGRRVNCVKQGGLPQDVAAAIAFLAVDGAWAVNGQTLRVCGGNMVGR